MDTFGTGKDFGLKSWSTNKDYYQPGFDFTNSSHDLWKQRDHKSRNKNWDYKYESIGASGKNDVHEINTGAARS